MKETWRRRQAVEPPLAGAGNDCLPYPWSIHGLVCPCRGGLFGIKGDIRSHIIGGIRHSALFTEHLPYAVGGTGR